MLVQTDSEMDLSAKAFLRPKQCLKLSQKRCRSSCLESQIININLKKNQQKVPGPPPKLSASDRRTCGNFQHWAQVYSEVLYFFILLYTIFKLCMMKTEVLMQYHTCFLCFCRWQYLLCCGSPPSNESAGGCAVTKETPASTEVVPGSAAVRLPGTTQQTCGYLLLILGRGYFAGKTEIWMLKKYNANKNM